MAGQRKSYTPEFKREAVRLITEGGLSPSQVARDLGVDRSLLGKWTQQLEVEAQSNNGHKAFPGHGHPHDEELARLRREVEILRQEREVLKKAVSIFAPQLR
jgi:transposase